MLNLKFAEVKRFYRAAAAHLDAARKLLDTCPEKVSSVRGHDAVYLSGYVVECGLKALFLSQHPQRKHPELVDWFREKLKHNLELLAERLAKAGVNFPKEHKDNLKRVRTAWSSEMRYDIRAWNREEVERVVLAAEAIFEWVERA
jgi:HEPN domain-containing protein